MIVAATVTVSSTPIKLAGAGAIVAAGQRVLIKNTASVAADKLIIGGSNVAANNGFGIDAGQILDIGNLEPGDVVWAIRGATTDIAAQVLVK
jgi:hypothetical protein